MKYEIVLSKEATKFLEKQEKSLVERILKAINQLPNIGDIKKLKGKENLFRLRVGSCRVIYTIIENKLIIMVLEIGNRG